MIKTSNIKEVVSVKPHTNSYGTTEYHCLLMENGDKINIGKKTVQKVGWELTYEITDDGQEYNKAKSAKKEEVTFSGPSFTPQAGKNDDVQRLIVRQNALTNAVKYHEKQGTSEAQILTTAQNFYEWVMKKD